MFRPEGVQSDLIWFSLLLAPDCLLCQFQLYDLLSEVCSTMFCCTQVKFNASTVSVLEGKVEGTEVSVVQDTVKESGVAVAGGKAEQAVVPTAARGTDESAGPESGNNLNEGANGVPDGQPIPITVERQAPRRILKTGKLRSLKKVAEAGGWGGN